MLLDTSGLLAYLFATEKSHLEAVPLFENRRRKLTHNLILTELVALAEARRHPRWRVLGFLRDVLADIRIEVVWVDGGIHGQAVDLLEARPDKSYSLCDAVSFVLMRERNIAEALTTDHHFEQEGFRLLLNP